MTNEVVLKDGIIEMIERGDQTKQKMLDMRTEVERLSQGLSPILILVDLNEVNRTDMGARKEAKKVADDMVFDRMAFIGASTFISTVLKLIIRASGKPRSIQFFKTRSQAIGWLNSD